MKALAAGKHVLVEKPGPLNAAQLRDIQTVATRSHALVRLGYNHRFHPALQKARALFADRIVNLIEEGFDVALRIDTLADSSLTAIKVGTVRRVVVASPAYLARAGTPRTPEDLIHHEVIIGPLGGRSGSWSFERDGRTSTVRVAGRVTTSTNQAATAAAVAGLGIASIGLWNCRSELASGVLVPVLSDWHLRPIELHALFAGGRATKPSARAFAAYLAAALTESTV